MDFFQSKAVKSKVHWNTETDFLSIFLFLALPLRDFGNAGTFHQNLFYRKNHVCIFVFVPGLLEYPK